MLILFEWGGHLFFPNENIVLTIFVPSMISVLTLISDLLCCQYFVVHIIQGGAVSHMESPKEGVPLLFNLLCLLKQMTKDLSLLY